MAKVTHEAALLQSEDTGKEYFSLGNFYYHNGEVYQISEKNDVLTFFESMKDQGQIVVPTENLHTFLPGVASRGMEFELWASDTFQMEGRQ